MLRTRGTAKPVGVHRARTPHRAWSIGMIDQRYEVTERRSSASPGGTSWLAHDHRLGRSVLVDVRPASTDATPDAALRAHVDLVGGSTDGKVFDGGYWARRGGPVTYVVTSVPPAAVADGRRRRPRGRVVQVA